MKIEEKKIEGLFEYVNNPRKNDEAVESVAASIKEFGFKVPIVIDSENVIVAGHTRVKAARKLKLKTVPCIVASDLTKEQIKAFRIADNRTGEFAEWDMEKLKIEIEGLDEKLKSEIGFDENEINELTGFEENANEYWKEEVTPPIYKPTREEKPEIHTLFDPERYEKLIDEIEGSGLPEEEKEFLKLAAGRHVRFDYKEIAEYYSHSEREFQELAENSGLVIIDFDKALEDGYIKLEKKILEAYLAEEADEDEDVLR